ncbi:MAG: hypothetical protein ACRDX8_14855 [Acidimicrobiales bacterium]
MSEEIADRLAGRVDRGESGEEALPEGIVERIGDEIDRRLDARLVLLTPALQRRRSPWAPLTLGLGSILLGLGTTAVVLDPGQSITTAGIQQGVASPEQIGLDALIWLVLGAINVAYARRLTRR